MFRSKSSLPFLNSLPLVLADRGVQHLWGYGSARRAPCGHQPGQDCVWGRDPPRNWGVGTFRCPETFSWLRLQENKSSQQGNELQFCSHCHWLSCFRPIVTVVFAFFTLKKMIKINAASWAEGCAQRSLWRSSLWSVSHAQSHDSCLLCQDFTCQAAQPACPQPPSVWI